MNNRQMKLIKRAFMPLTDQAMAAQPASPQGGMPPVDPATGMPMDPSMMPPAGGMPMGPSMMPTPGGMPPVDPATGMPMDPSMMPPPGGMPPVDPATGMPMDPAMMSPAGAAQQTGDPVLDTLISMGVMLMDPSTGQPIPPEMLSQLVQEIGAQGGMTPTDPNQDAVMETLVQMEKDLAILTDKVDSMRAIMDGMRSTDQDTKGTAAEDTDAMDAELREFLQEQALAGIQQPAPEMLGAPSVQQTLPAAPTPGYGSPLDPQQMQQLSLMEAMHQ